VNRLVSSSLALATVAGCLLITTPANADPLCREGYYLPSSGVLCVPDPNAPGGVSQAVAPQAAPIAPAPAPAHRSVLDRLLGRNRPPAPAAPAPPPAQPAPVVVIPPAQPAPAPPPPGDAGGNSASGGDAGLVGPLGPVVSPGTGSGPDSGANGIGLVPGGSKCSPGAVIVILGSNQTCPPAAVYTVPAAPGQTVVVTNQPPTAAQALIPQYSLPVTH
jgi:hypothetical protein